MSVLEAFQGLQEIHFIARFGKKLDVSSNIRHGATLKTLIVETNRCGPSKTEAQCINAGDLSLIAASCPKLEQLALPLYSINPEDEDAPDYDIIGPRPGHPHVRTELEAALDAIASMENLHTLRISDATSYTSERTMPKTPKQQAEWRYAFQARAHGVIQYLAARSSGVKVLGFSPVVKILACKVPDQIGHFWPHYFCTRGTTRDVLGAVTTVARPLQDWKVDFPASIVLQGYHEDW